MQSATSILKKVYNKHNDRNEWAIVSKKDPNKILQWFGLEKPSEEKVQEVEKRVQFFKHVNASTEKLEYIRLESIICLIDRNKIDILNVETDDLSEAILGVAEIRNNNKYQSYELEAVYSFKGYGMKLLACVLDSINPMYLIPDQTGRHSDEFKAFWKKAVKFFESKKIKDETGLIARTNIPISNLSKERQLSIIGQADNTLAFEMHKIYAHASSQVNWIWPTKADFDNEWKTEDFLAFFSSAYEKDDVQDKWKELLFNNLKEVSSVIKIDKSMLKASNPDYYQASSIEDLKRKISYMKKDIDSIVKQFESNGDLYMPILIERNGVIRTLGGRTRLSVAFILDKEIKGIVINEDKLNSLVISPIKRDIFLKNGSIFVRDTESKQAILDYIDGKVSIEDLKKFPEIAELDSKDKEALDYVVDLTRRQIKKTQSSKKKIGNPKFMTLEQLKRISNDPYFRGIDGADYDVIREEIEQRLWELENKKNDKSFEKRLKEMEEYEEMLEKSVASSNVICNYIIESLELFNEKAMQIGWTNPDVITNKVFQNLEKMSPNKITPTKKIVYETSSSFSLVERTRTRNLCKSLVKNFLASFIQGLKRITTKDDTWLDVRALIEPFTSLNYESINFNTNASNKEMKMKALFNDKKFGTLFNVGDKLKLKNLLSDKEEIKTVEKFDGLEYVFTDNTKLGHSGYAIEGGKFYILINKSPMIEITKIADATIIEKLTKAGIKVENGKISKADVERLKKVLASNDDLIKNIEECIKLLDIIIETSTLHTSDLKAYKDFKNILLEDLENINTKTKASFDLDGFYCVRELKSLAEGFNKESKLIKIDTTADKNKGVFCIPDADGFMHEGYLDGNVYIHPSEKAYKFIELEAKKLGCSVEYNNTRSCFWLKKVSESEFDGETIEEVIETFLSEFECEPSKVSKSQIQEFLKRNGFDYTVDEILEGYANITESAYAHNY